VVVGTAVRSDALAALLVAFFVGSALGLEPAWIALVDAAVVGGAGVGMGRARPPAS
jgi:hypothetical protein